MNFSQLSTRGASSVMVIVGVLVLVAVGAWFFVGQNQPAAEPVQLIPTKSNVPAEPAVAADNNTANTQAVEESEPTPAPLPPAEEQALAAGIFTDYDASLLQKADDGPVILFFHADWCPTCRGLENNINSNAENIPANVTLLKVNFDTEAELKKKYGVVRQHTLVQVDAAGNEIKTFTGLTNTLEQVVNQI